MKCWLQVKLSEIIDIKEKVRNLFPWERSKSSTPVLVVVALPLTLCDLRQEAEPMEPSVLIWKTKPISLLSLDCFED